MTWTPQPRLFLSFAVVLALLAPRAADAAFEAGERLRAMVTVQGKQVPLPAGEWVVMGQATAADRAGLALGRLVGTRVEAAVLVQASLRPAPPRAQRLAWGTAPGCRRADLPFAVVRYATERDGSCVYGARVRAARAIGVDPAWAAAGDFAAARGWSLPVEWEAAVFRVTDPRDGIEIRYAFPPGTPGGAPALRAWAFAVWDMVEDGFRNRLVPSEDTILPATPAMGLDAAPPDPSAAGTADHLGHLGVKMVTYRIFGTLTDLSVNYFWLGSLPSATGLAVLGAVASSTLYFVHELVWSRFEGPTDAALALPGIGREGPFVPGRQ